MTTQSPVGKYAIELASFSPLTSSIFYNLLHPTFVWQYNTDHGQGLCSDAFSSWLQYDTRQNQLCEDVVAATQHLYRHVIPEFAKKLEKRYQEQGIDFSDFDIISEIHSYVICLVLEFDILALE